MPAETEDDEKTRADAQWLFGELLKADEAVAALETEEADAMRPYIEAEQAGRYLARPQNALLQWPLNITASSSIPPAKSLLELVEKYSNMTAEESE